MAVPATAVAGAETTKCVAEVTVTTATGLDVIVPCFAVILAVPACSPLTCPWVPDVLLTVATGVLEEAQVALVVRFWVLLSE